MSKMLRNFSCAFAVVFMLATKALAEPLVKKLDEGIYHVWAAFYSSLIVIGDDDVLITDPANEERAKSLSKIVGKLTDTPVTKIVLTHEHYDHVGGTDVFPDAEVICHQNCQSVFILDEIGQVPNNVDVTFTDYLAVNMGDKLVELHHYGAGDGTATTLMHLPGYNIVVTADMYGNRTLTEPAFMDDVNYQGVRRILNNAVALRPRYSITSHSPNVDPGELKVAAEFVNKLYYRTRTELEKVLADGGGFPAFMAAMPTLHERIDLSEYRHWKNYDQYFPKHVRRMALSIFHGG